MTVMRDQPEGLRSVILDGPLPAERQPVRDAPDRLHDRARRAVRALRRRRRLRRDAIPTSSGASSALLDSAAETPIPVVVKNPVDGSPVRLDVGDTDLTGGLFDALYDADAVRVLPFLIDQLSHGQHRADPSARAAQPRLPRLLHGGTRPLGRMRRGGAVQRRRAHRRGARGGSDPRALRAARGLPRGLRRRGRFPPLSDDREPGGRERASRR